MTSFTTAAIDNMITNHGKGNPELVNLPRKINIGLATTRDDFAHTHINDVGLYAAKDPETGKVSSPSACNVHMCCGLARMQLWGLMWGLCGVDPPILLCCQCGNIKEAQCFQRIRWLACA